MQLVDFPLLGVLWLGLGGVRETPQPCNFYLNQASHVPTALRSPAPGWDSAFV